MATKPRRASSRQFEISPVVACLAAVVFLCSFPSVLRDLTPNAPNQFDFHAVLFASDFALVGAIALAVRRWRKPSIVVVLAGAVLIGLAIAWLVHPSTRGALTLFRWTGVVAIASLVRDRRHVTAVIGAWAVAEAVVAFLQKIHGGALGLPGANERNLSFVHFGKSLAPPGTLVHPYLLAGLALIGGAVLAIAARERRGLLVAAAVAVAPVGFTYSRTALIGLVLVAACFVIARYPAAAVALAIGVALPALAWSDGWVNRTELGSAATGTGIDTGRGALMHQAVDLVRDHPVTGVGPGQYVKALADRGTDTKVSGGYLKPVHNVPLLAAAEGGVLTGLAMLALLAATGVVALRRGGLAVALYLAALPFWMLDHFMYTFPQGMVIAALWIGAVTAAPASLSTRRGTSV